MIEIRDLHKRFGEVAAVNGISFSAANGTITGILSENGAGKTTTLAMICGLLAADSGWIHIDGGGGGINGDPLGGRKRLGALLDHPGLYPRLTARENIVFQLSWSLGRGLSKPGSATPAAFLNFSILSCQRRRRAISAASVLYATILTFNVTWVYQTRSVQLGVWAFLTSERVVIIVVITAALAAFALWSRRKLKRELQNLLTLRQQLEESGSG